MCMRVREAPPSARSNSPFQVCWPMAVAQTSKSVSSSAELFIVKLVERKTKIERCQISTSQICDVNGTSKFTFKSHERGMSMILGVCCLERIPFVNVFDFVVLSCWWPPSSREEDEAKMARVFVALVRATGSSSRNLSSEAMEQGLRMHGLFNFTASSSDPVSGRDTVALPEAYQATCSISSTCIYICISMYLRVSIRRGILRIQCMCMYYEV